VVAIPTTAGTGSDATWVAVLSDREQNVKIDHIASRELTPDLSILDPRLIMKLPREATAYSGLDSLTQGIEAYVNQWRNDFSDGLALQSIKLVFEYLPKAYENPDDLLARQKTQNAATMSGLAFGNAQVGLSHAMGHALGAVFHMPHGLAVAVSNLYVIEYSRRDAAERYADVARVIGVKDDIDEKAVDALVERIKQLMKRLNTPLSLGETRVSRAAFEQEIDALVEKTNRSTCTFVNPRVPDVEEIRKLFVCMYEGVPVNF
jgi:acetaldehyde dehydrogenase/alcohol dehydrogenase